MKVKLRDKTWSVTRADLGPSVRGQIDPPTYARRQLKMSTRIKKNQEFLEVFIHECLHGCFWDIDEEAKKNYYGTLDKNALVFKLMMRQPDFVSAGFALETIERTKRKKPHQLLEKLYLHIQLRLQLMQSGNLSTNV